MNYKNVPSKDIFKKKSRSDLSDISDSERGGLLCKKGPVPPCQKILTTCYLRDSLEFNIGFIIRRKKKWHSYEKTYEISNDHNNSLLFVGSQKIQWCSWPWRKNKDYEDINIYGNTNQLMFSIRETEFSGYLSKTLRFEVISNTGGKLAEIAKVSEFLEQPKYEIMDGSGNAMFSLVFGIGTHANSDRHFSSVDKFNDYVTCKSGKVAKISEERDSVLAVNLHQPCSVPEKILLLSLVLILDTVERT